MVLESYRFKFREIFKPIANKIGKIGITPNIISGLSFLLALISGILFFFGYLLQPALMLALSGLADSIDGIVARELDVSSKPGDFIDHTLDRFSDTSILLGIIYSGNVSVIWGILALIGVLITGYIGSQSEAVGMERVYKGIFGRADIMAILFFFSVLSFFMAPTMSENLYILEIGVIILAVGCNLTSIQRIAIIWKKF